MDSTAIANQISEYDKNKVTSTDALNQALTQYGVPEIRKTVAGMRTTLANTQNAFNQVDPSVTGRTSGSLVTEAQRTKQISNERAPIAEQIAGQSTALNTNQTALTEAEQQANQLATNKVNDYNTGRQALQSQYDNTYKREQDTIAGQIAAEQAKREQQNSDRQYALASQKTSAPASPAQVKLEVGQHVAQGLSSSTGKDGFVSNETWSAALNDAVAAGFTPREFFQKYSQFVNPKYKTSYAGWANR